MSTPPLLIRPDTVAGLARELSSVVGTIRYLASTSRDDDTAAMLDGRVLPALAILDETADELSLAQAVLTATADAAVHADHVDLGGLCVSMPKSVAALMRQQSLLQKLDTSLMDGIGLRPVDLRGRRDPRLAGGDDYQLGHFGWVPLFGVDGPRPDDVDQNQLGDCWLLAALASVAEFSPTRVEEMITDNGDGTYTVHFSIGDIVVDDELPYYIDDEGNVKLAYAGGMIEHDTALWPSIIEKALAILEGNSYGLLIGGGGEDAFKRIIGDGKSIPANDPNWFDSSDEEIYEFVNDAISNGDAVTAGSRTAFGMGGKHEWSVLGMETADDGKVWVTVRNPWGIDGMVQDGADGPLVYVSADPETKVAVDFDSADDAAQIDLGSARDGVVRMPLEVFAANFFRVDRSKQKRD